MNNILKYYAIFAALILLNSCSSGGGDDTPPPPQPKENKAPESVSMLIYPTNNLLCIDNTITFEWGASTDPNGDTVSYTLEIASDNSFSTIVSTNTVTTTSKTVTLEKGKAFYWRVQAKDTKSLTSDYSPVYQFYTEGEGEVNHIPFSPSLISPNSDNNIDSGTITLEWSANDVDNDPLTFDVYLDTANPPNTKVGDNQSETSINTTVNPSTTYYWKVVVKDDNGAASVGQAWSFTTN